MSTNHTILKGVNLHKRFRVQTASGKSAGLLTAVDGATLEIAGGETVGIAGESGCGKSTLGKLMAGLLKPDTGDVIYRDTAISAMSRSESATFRRHTQMIFQDPFSSLNPRMRIGDIIAEPMLIAKSEPPSSLRKRAEDLMASVGLRPEQYDRFPHEFSGGQRQRIGIARALSSSPAVIIADEPVSSLDVSIQAQIINLLQSLKNEYNLSMLIISHDLSVLRHICDRICIMYLGSIVEIAPTSELFCRCLHPYTEALLAAIPSLDPDMRQNIMLKDDLPSPLSLPTGCRFHPRCRYAEEICRRESPGLTSHKGHYSACHLSGTIFPKP